MVQRVFAPALLNEVFLCEANVGKASQRRCVCGSAAQASSAGPGCLSADVRCTEISHSAPREQLEKKLHNGATGGRVDVNRLHHVVMKQKLSWDDIHGSQTST